MTTCFLLPNLLLIFSCLFPCVQLIERGGKSWACMSQASPVVPRSNRLVTRSFGYPACTAAAVSSFPPGWEPATEEAGMLGTPAGIPASVSLLASISTFLPRSRSPECVTTFSFICSYFLLPSYLQPSSSTWLHSSISLFLLPSISSLPNHWHESNIILKKLPPGGGLPYILICVIFLSHRMW